MSGDLRDYDNLCEALEALEETAPSDPCRTDRYWTLRRAAVRCGAELGEPVVAFAKRRRETYRSIVAGAVSRIQSQIDALPASDAMCGGKS